jgi:hypothetical protein
MDSNFSELVKDKENLSFEDLENASQRCCRQVLYWALEDPEYMKTKSEKVYQCKELTDYYGHKLLRDVVKSKPLDD